MIILVAIIRQRYLRRIPKRTSLHISNEIMSWKVTIFLILIWSQILPKLKGSSHENWKFNWYISITLTIPTRLPKIGLISVCQAVTSTCVNYFSNYVIALFPFSEKFSKTLWAIHWFQKGDYDSSRIFSTTIFALLLETHSWVLTQQIIKNYDVTREQFQWNSVFPHACSNMIDHVVFNFFTVAVGTMIRKIARSQSMLPFKLEIKMEPKKYETRLQNIYNV